MKLPVALLLTAFVALLLVAVFAPLILIGGPSSDRPADAAAPRAANFAGRSAQGSATCSRPAFATPGVRVSASC